LTWYSISNPDSEVRPLLILYLILTMVVPIAILIITVLRMKQYPNLFNMQFSGILEWDLYESGILTKHYSPASPDNIERRFFPFDDMSRIVIYPERHRIDEILELYKAKLWEKKPKDQRADANPPNGMSQNISNTIWFIDRNGKLMDLTMQRYFMKPGARLIFKNLLHRKVNTVE
jgi:hypothetical protein